MSLKKKFQNSKAKINMITPIDSLEKSLIKYKTIADITKASEYIRDDILKKMAELRIPCDEAETLTAEKYWPFPTYGELLFGVR